MGQGPRIAIVGGGFTGAAIAYHLAQLRPEDPPVTVVEPREFLGSGLAYSSLEPAHRINVPAARMSLLPDDPEHFARWLDASGELDRDPDALWSRTGAAFPQRSIFGRYVAEHLEASIAAGRTVHLRGRAVAAHRAQGDGWTVELGSGGRLDADILILATTHPLPGTPRELDGIAEAPGYVADPYDPAALDGLPPDARVLVVGSGLTAADVVATLDGKGHRGPILSLSRNGLRSRGHTAQKGDRDADFGPAAADGVVALVRAIRAEIAAAGAKGEPWQWVMDSVRDQGEAIWARLHLEERRLLVRRLRSFWDVHRFRIAPQVEAVLDRRAAQGSFEHVAARLVGSSVSGEGLCVTFRRRGAAGGETRSFDLVVNTTGPSHRGVLSGAGLLPSLAAAGHLRCDAVGLGLEANVHGRAVGADGRARATLFVAGPLARGTFGELMGLPEVSRYAHFVADRVAAVESIRPLARSA